MTKQKTKINRQILITIILIALIALIGFNFNALTGNATKSLMPDVTVYPSTVKAGEKINIKVKPNRGCVLLRACLRDFNPASMCCSPAALPAPGGRTPTQADPRSIRFRCNS